MLTCWSFPHESRRGKEWGITQQKRRQTAETHRKAGVVYCFEIKHVHPTESISSHVFHLPCLCYISQPPPDLQLLEKSLRPKPELFSKTTQTQGSHSSAGTPAPTVGRVAGRRHAAHFSVGGDPSLSPRCLPSGCLL